MCDEHRADPNLYKFPKAKYNSSSASTGDEVLLSRKLDLGHRIAETVMSGPMASFRSGMDFILKVVSLVELCFNQ